MDSARFGTFGSTFAFAASLAAGSSGVLARNTGINLFEIAAALFAALAGVTVLRANAKLRAARQTPNATTCPSERQLTALGHAIEEMIERHERLTRALRVEAGAAVRLADATGIALFDLRSPKNVSVLAEIRASVSSLAHALHEMGAATGALAVSIHQSEGHLSETATAVALAKGAACTAETNVYRLAEAARTLVGDLARIHHEVGGGSPALEQMTRTSLLRTEQEREAATGAERAVASLRETIANATDLLERVASSTREEAARATTLMQTVEHMNRLLRASSQLFDMHEGHNAYERIEEAARHFAVAHKAGGDASAGIDEIMHGLKARLATIIDDVYVANCINAPGEHYGPLGPGNSHPSAGRYESKSS